MSSIEKAEINIIVNQSYNPGYGTAALETYRSLKEAISNLKMYSVNYFRGFNLPPLINLSRHYSNSIFSVPIVNWLNFRHLRKNSIFENKNIHLLGSDYSLVEVSERCVLTVHAYYYETLGLFREPSLTSALKDIYRNLEEIRLKKFIKKSRNIIAPSKESANQIYRGTGILPKVAYFPVDRERFYLRGKEEVRKQLNLPSNKKILINVSGGGANKNLKTLKQMADRLPKEVILLKVNYPIDSPNVINLGKVDDVMYPLYLSASDLYVHTSVREGFGIPMAESMASGLPVIAPRVSTAPEVLEKAGFFVNEPKDYSGFLDAIFALIDDKAKYDELVFLGSERVRFFSKENYRDSVLRVYEKAFSF